MSVELCGARDGAWTCARVAGHGGDHRAIGRDRDYHWTNQSDLLRERDELREALVACAAALDPHLDRMLQQQGACGDTFRANARAEARAVLSKVTP